MTTTSTIGYRELDAILEQARRDPESVVSISDEQLVGLQLRWTRSLSARLDQAIESDGLGFDSVVIAWRALAAEQATLRTVLDAAERRSAALRAAMSMEFRYLALATGMVGANDQGDGAIRRGRACRDRIRSPQTSSSVAGRAA